MATIDHINAYIADQREPKRSEMRRLHDLVVSIAPKTRLWFMDGTDEQGRTIANPSIGYGAYMIRYAKGTTREFYQVGVSSNTTGISVYILGLDDKTYLAKTYGNRLGRASVTGYCIKFKTLKEIDLGVLEEAIRTGLGVSPLNAGPHRSAEKKKTNNASNT